MKQPPPIPCIICKRDIRKARKKRSKMLPKPRFKTCCKECAKIYMKKLSNDYKRIPKKPCVICGKDVNRARKSKWQRKVSQRFRTCSRECSRKYHYYIHHKNNVITKYLKQKNERNKIK